MKKILFIIVFISSLAHANKSGVEVAGDILQIALPVYAGAHTLLAKDFHGTGQFALSFTTTISTVYLLKYTVNRTRPNGGVHSFPSGHTASAFSSSSFIWRRYGWKFGVPATVAASFVGFSRVYAEKHYPADVLASIAISVGCTFIFTKRQEIEVSPILGNKAYGLQVSGVF